jgi:hypothetical protein
MVSADCGATSASRSVLVNSLWSLPRVEQLGKSQHRCEH